MKHSFFLSTIILGTVIFLGPFQALGLEVRLEESKLYSGTRKTKLEQAIPFLETAINSPEFRERILNFEYQGKKEFVQNLGLTNQQIYDRLIEGAEIAPSPTQADQIMNLFLSTYRPRWYQSKNVIGYTNPQTKTIFTNVYFIDRASLGDLAGHYAHEWTHKIGFDHDFKRTARRPYSVPYAVGDILSSIVQKLNR